MKENKDWMKNYSLNQIEAMFNNGTVTEKEVEEYLIAWNATPGRFTKATFSGRYIYNREIK